MRKLLFILLLLPVLAQAQTRFYLNNTGASDVSPVPNQWAGTTSGGWSNVSSFDRILMTTSKNNSTMTSKVSAASGGQNGMPLIRQYVSPPLDAQTLLANTTMKIQVRMSISSVASSTVGYIAFMAYIYRANGTYTSMFYTSPNYSSNSAFTTALTNKGSATTTFGLAPFNYTINQGDRLVFEIGWIQFSGTNTGRTATASFGSDNATNLPQDLTTTTANTPWMEVSQTLLFYSPPVVAKPHSIQIIN